MLSDIDECGLTIDGCSENCTNTIGSFKCTCPISGSGFRPIGTECVGMYVTLLCED